MPQVKLFLFGPPRLYQDDEEIRLRSRKIMALAAYLAVSQQPHSRDALATLLWPDHDQAGARANLRRELSLLKKALGEGQLAIEPNSIGLQPEVSLWLDVARFQTCLATTQTHSHPADEVCPDCLHLLSEAAGLYTADFLSGFTLSDSPEFDEWQFFQAEGLRQALATALVRLVQGYSAQGNLEAAIAYARRWLSLEPLHEPTHRQLMQLYAQSGQQTAALRQYQECVRLLKAELSALPSAETVALYEAIKAKRFPPLSQPVSTPSEPCLPMVRPHIALPDLRQGGRYKQEEEISRGGFAVVYRGWDTLLERPVALKILHSRLLSDTVWLNRFREEARLIARLDHPRIVPVYDIDETAGSLTIVMRLIKGSGLDEVLARQGRLAWPQVVETIEAVAEGLDYAHRQGILHRDLKPANILLDQERGPLLSDFGLAKLVSDHSLSQSRAIVGTPHYLPPEIWNGQPANPQTDLYALGCVLYELVTGQKLFSGESPLAVMTAHFMPMALTERWPPDVPPGFGEIIHRAVGREPEQRYTTARALAQALTDLASAEARLETGSQESKNPEDFSAPPPLARVSSRPQSNLPLQSTPFFGREEELAGISQRLREEAGCRLLTLVGPGGMGKTRLSIEAASAQLTTFADGVVFVPLAPINPADFEGSIDPLVATMADTLKIAFHARTTPTRQLLDYLCEKEMLIVLDNFEHLLDSAEVVSTIVTSASQVKLLVTSRERLNLPEEWLYPLEGLAVPKETSPLIGGYSGLQLFEQCARQVKPKFELSHELIWVIRICRLVEGLPLGIQLAAAWVRLLSCQAIAAEIEKNVDFLATTMRTVPDRHRSLRAVFEHSWQRLSTPEQDVLRRLSVFQGGFQAEAAEAVASATLPLLASLADQSLLQVNPSGRYELHELLRQFALDKLQDSAEGYEGVRNRHSQYFAIFLQQQESRLKEAGLKSGLAAILADLDNIRLSWHWAVERNRQAEIEQSLESLFLLYETQGWFLEGEEAFQRAATMLTAQYELLEIASEDAAVPESCILYGRVLFRQSWFQARLGLYERLEAQFQKSLWLLRRAGERLRWEVAFCLFWFSCSLLVKAEYKKALSPGQESLAIFESLGDLWGRGLALLSLSMATFSPGQFEEAERFAQESITMLSQVGDRRFIIYSMGILARIAIVRGNYPQAEGWYQECLKRRTELEDRAGMAFTFSDLGETARLQDQPDKARQYYQQSLTLAKEIGLRVVQYYAAWGLAGLAERMGHYAEAKRLFQESLAASENRNPTQFNLAGPGWTLLGLGEVQEATDYFQDSLRFALQNGIAPLALDVLAGTAYVLAQVGKLEQALELLALVQEHPSSHQETKARGTKLHDELITKLPPEMIAAAKARGKERTLEAMVAEILAGEYQDHLT